MNKVIDENLAKEVKEFMESEESHGFWHSTSHVLAQAVKRLFPEAKLGIGPAIDTGFYYDFDLEHKFTEEDLVAIEKEMRKIVKSNLKIEGYTLSREEAINFFEENDEPYKIELINDLDENEDISFYKQAEFTDLCRGPHIKSTAQIKAIKLLSVAGAYWRGSEKNKMLQRIYGTAFKRYDLLECYLNMLEEAKNRDHRKIGKEMDLFMMSDAGQGFPFFLPNGMIIRNELENFWRIEHMKNGYEEIKTPLILSEELWHTSGHWDHYKDNMYFTQIDGENYAIKPMNCPGALIAYKRKMYSYRDLPIRMGELGQVHRHELSGVLHGLMRVRTFTQDDAHIFMLREQVKEEIAKVIDLIDEVYKLFGFKYHVELSTRPEKSMGSDEDWEMSTLALKESLEEKNIDYIINEGDGAFYGPKIDFHLEDSLNRTWQCGTIQLDFQMPKRFDLTYVGSDGEKHRPVMIHRVIFGSIERFIGILTEHFSGKYPLWLAPVHVRILTVSEKFNDYAIELEETFREAGLRAFADKRNEKIGYKIREARIRRDSYLVIIGEKEVNSGELTIRSSKKGELGTMSTATFINMLKKEIADKEL